MLLLHKYTNQIDLVFHHLEKLLPKFWWFDRIWLCFNTFNDSLLSIWRSIREFIRPNQKTKKTQTKIADDLKIVSFIWIDQMNSILRLFLYWTDTRPVDWSCIGHKMSVGFEFDIFMLSDTWIKLFHVKRFIDVIDDWYWLIAKIRNRRCILFNGIGMCPEKVRFGFSFFEELEWILNFCLIWLGTCDAQECLIATFWTLFWWLKILFLFLFSLFEFGDSLLWFFRKVVI